MSIHDLPYRLKVFKTTQTPYVGKVGERSNEKKKD